MVKAFTTFSSQSEIPYEVLFSFQTEKHNIAKNQDNKRIMSFRNFGKKATLNTQLKDKKNKQLKFEAFEKGVILDDGTSIECSFMAASIIDKGVEWELKLQNSQETQIFHYLLESCDKGWTIDEILKNRPRNLHGFNNSITKCGMVARVGKTGMAEDRCMILVPGKLFLFFKEDNYCRFVANLHDAEVVAGDKASSLTIKLIGHKDVVIILQDEAEQTEWLEAINASRDLESDFQTPAEIQEEKEAKEQAEADAAAKKKADEEAQAQAEADAKTKEENEKAQALAEEEAKRKEENDAKAAEEAAKVAREQAEADALAAKLEAEQFAKEQAEEAERAAKKKIEDEAIARQNRIEEERKMQEIQMLLKTDKNAAERKATSYSSSEMQAQKEWEQLKKDSNLETMDDQERFFLEHFNAGLGHPDVTADKVKAQRDIFEPAAPKSGELEKDGSLHLLEKTNQTMTFMELLSMMSVMDSNGDGRLSLLEWLCYTFKKSWEELQKEVKVRTKELAEAEDEMEAVKQVEAGYSRDRAKSKATKKLAVQKEANLKKKEESSSGASKMKLMFERKAREESKNAGTTEDIKKTLEHDRAKKKEESRIAAEKKIADEKMAEAQAEADRLAKAGYEQEMAEQKERDRIKAEAAKKERDEKRARLAKKAAMFGG